MVDDDTIMTLHVDGVALNARAYDNHGSVALEAGTIAPLRPAL